MSAQLLPPLSQRDHWYDSVIGCTPVHVPLLTVSVEPELALPAIDGFTEFTGADPTA